MSTMIVEQCNMGGKQNKTMNAISEALKTAVSISVITPTVLYWHLNVHETFPLNKRFFTVQKGSLNYYLTSELLPKPSVKRKKMQL